MSTGAGQKFRKLFREYQKMFTFLIILGGIALILSILTHFTSLTDTKVDTFSTVQMDLKTPEFFQIVESITGSSMIPLNGNDSIKVLNNGDEFLPDFLNEISKAKESITLTNYIFKEGQMMDSIFDALTIKAKDGVKVRVLMDGKGALDRPKEKIKELTDAGGDVETFRPLRFRTLTRINKRTHVRAISIDGKVSYTGGLPFSDEWLGDGTGGKGHWRDIMFKVTGMPARSIQNMFNSMWRQTTGEILAGPEFYPPLPPDIVGEAVCKKSCFTSLLHAPSPDLEKNLSQLIWLSIMGAKKNIYMETPYLLPDQNILNALKKKAEEGVDVEILVPGPYIDSKIVQVASKSFYPEVLASGIKIYEYQAAGFHSKVFTADGHWSIIGSPNLDNRSSTLNVEDVLLVEDQKLAQEIEKEINKDKERSVHVTESHAKPNQFILFLGEISRLFSKQY